MRHSLLFTAAAFALLCSTSAFAQDTARGIGVYGSFFAPQGQPAPRPAPPAKAQPAQAENAKPRVVCGTTLIPPRKNVDDRAILIAPPTNRKFAMRIIEPQVCASTNARTPSEK